MSHLVDWVGIIGAHIDAPIIPVEFVLSGSDVY